MYPDDQEVSANMAVYLEHLLGEQQEQAWAGTGATEAAAAAGAGAAAASDVDAAEGVQQLVPATARTVALLPKAGGRQAGQAKGASSSSSSGSSRSMNIPESLLVQAGRMFRKVVPGGQVRGPWQQGDKARGKGDNSGWLLRSPHQSYVSGGGAKRSGG